MKKKHLGFLAILFGFLGPVVYLFLADSSTGLLGWVAALLIRHLGAVDEVTPVFLLLALWFGLWFLVGTGLKKWGIGADVSAPRTWTATPARAVVRRWIWVGSGVLGVTWLLGAVGWALGSQTGSESLVPIDVSIGQLGPQTPSRVLLQAHRDPDHKVSFMKSSGGGNVPSKEQTLDYLPLIDPNGKGGPVKVVWVKDRQRFVIEKKPVVLHPVQLEAGKVPTWVRQAMEAKGVAFAETVYLATSEALVDGRWEARPLVSEALLTLWLVIGTALGLKAFLSAFEKHREARRGA